MHECDHRLVFLLCPLVEKICVVCLRRQETTEKFGTLQPAVYAVMTCTKRTVLTKDNSIYFMKYLNV